MSSDVRGFWLRQCAQVCASATCLSCLCSGALAFLTLRVSPAERAAEVMRPKLTPAFLDWVARQSTTASPLSAGSEAWWARGASSCPLPRPVPLALLRAVTQRAVALAPRMLKCRDLDAAVRLLPAELE